MGKGLVRAALVFGEIEGEPGDRVTLKLQRWTAPIAHDFAVLVHEYFVHSAVILHFEDV